MRDRLVDQVQEFIFKKELSMSHPLLLGYSGGPDSKALLYILLAMQRPLPFELVLVHVDHGWRAESEWEAEQIQAEATHLGLRLYQQKMDGPARANRELAARVERLTFFRKIYFQEGAVGLLLAHQADDQAETVLKRLFEGAHPTHWKGIEADSLLNGMRVLRPLLQTPKQVLLDWLAARGEEGFMDSTNRDPQFLRARMRSELIPLLSERFGKNIVHNLCYAAEMNSELDDYFRKRCMPYFTQQQIVGQEIHWDLTRISEKIELGWALKYWLDEKCLKVSRAVLREIVEAVWSRATNRQFLIANGKFCVSRGKLVYCFSL